MRTPLLLSVAASALLMLVLVLFLAGQMQLALALCIVISGALIVGRLITWRDPVDTEPDWDGRGEP